MTASTPAGDRQDLGGWLNQLRAGVLGANDGIVSTAGIVIGMAAATRSVPVILTAGLAGLTSGALSMASGEYVSVSTQRDTERALLEAERQHLSRDPEVALDELTQEYVDKGLSDGLARQVAAELSAGDALAAHADAELHLDPEALTNPWEAALASIVSFVIGGLLPLLAIVLVPVSARIPVTFAAVVLALVLTGWVSARLGHAPAARATVRTVIGGALAMVATYALGSAFNL
ncbi:VIT1/CCC1 transporter family protein [Mumia zhuanghuii]|uniref:VIT family protein n=1 Tax=Mumia zhuanghuii TaxID=2585211 RepID=A0A5C4M3B6_9ACTN|nr:VIT family protein [Mumia zhuanghuii]TNC26316.1 VIT family protein [Mumia zhuanghuii]